MAVELASAYISLSANTSKIPGQVKKALGGVETQTAKSGNSIGSKLSAGIGKTLKAGVAGVGLAAGTALGATFVKGFDRLKAIEQSEAKLKGLGHSTKGVAKIMDNALGSVKGTAYGLGDAASVAAGMVASGVKPGKELEGVLKTVGDTAAISGRSINDIGLIFQSVAARGKLQGDDMLQLMSSGIPVLQLLADETGKTSAEVSDMVSKGEVDFATFERAMKKGMGGAALEMGNTFSGAVANVGAAMGRLGETILSSGFNAAPAVLTKVTEALDVMNEKVAESIRYFSTGKLVNEDGSAMGLSPKTVAVIDNARGAVDRFRGAAELLFTGDFTGDIGKKLGVSEDSPLVDQILNIRELFIDWGERVGQVFKELGDIAKQLAPSFGRIAASLGKAAAKVSAATWEALLRIVEALVPVLEKVLVPTFEKLADVMEDHPRLVEALVIAFAGFKVLKIIAGPIKAIVGTFKALKVAVGTAKAVLTIGGKGSIVTAIKGFGAAAAGAAPKGGLLARIIGKVSAVAKPVSSVFGKLSPILAKVGGKLGLAGLASIAGKTLLKFIPFVGWVWTAYEALKWFFTKTETGAKVFEWLKDVLSSFTGWVGETFTNIWGGVTEAWSAAWGGITGFFSGVWENIQMIWTGFGKPIFDTIRNAAGGLWDILKWSYENILKNVLFSIVGLFAFAWEGIKWVFDVIKNAALTLWDGLKWAWDAIGRPVINAVVGAFHWLWGGVKIVFGWIKAGWNAVWGFLKAAWDTVGQPVVNFVKAGFDRFWGGLKSIFGWIKSGWSILWEFFRSVWNAVGQPVVDFIVSKFNWFKDRIGAIFNIIKGFASGLLEAIREKFNAIAGVVGGIKDRIMSAVSGAGKWLYQTGKWIVEGLINGIKAMWNKATDVVGNLGKALVNKGKDVLGIGSPSKIFKQYGKWVGEGLVIGINSMTGKVADAAENMASGVSGVEVAGPTMGDAPAPVAPAASAAAAPPTRGTPPAIAASASFDVAAGSMQASVTGTITPAMEMADGAIGTFGQSVMNTAQAVVTPAMTNAGNAIGSFGNKVITTAQGIINPQINGMSNNIMSKAVGVINPAMAAVRYGLTQTGAWMTNRVQTVMNPQWNAMGANMQRVWGAVTNPNLIAMRNGLTQTASWLQSRVQTVMNPMWNNMGANIQRVWTAAVNPTFGALRNGLTQTASWFSQTVNNINSAWHRIKAGTGRPAKFVVQTVFNNGIRNAWNSIAEMIDKKPMRPVGLGNLGGYKTGGVLPGYTPGKDVHHFRSPTGGSLHLSGGEAVMRPEWTRAVGGPKAVNAMNAAARSGKWKKKARGEAGANGYEQAFAGGGIIQAMSNIVKKKYPGMTLTSSIRNSSDYHGRGMATDWSDGHRTPGELRLAKDIARTYPGTAELIHDQPGWSGNIKDGRKVGAFGGFYNNGNAGPHYHHVHWAMTVPPRIPFGGGVFHGGGGGGAAAMVSMVDTLKEQWDSEIKKIPKYNANKGLFDQSVAPIKKKWTDQTWKYAEKQAEKMEEEMGAASGSGSRNVQVYRPGIQKAFKFQGENGTTARVNALLRQIQTESNGDPNISQQIVDVNGTGDAAGVGLYQVIPSTWAGFRDPRLPNNRRNVWAAHNFAVRYFRDKHHWNMGPGGVGIPGRGWKTGGVLPADLPGTLLYDNGGYLKDGETGTNKSGKPEPVFTHKQWKVLKGNIFSSAKAGDFDKLQKNLGKLAWGIEQAAKRMDWNEVAKAFTKTFNAEFRKGQEADVRSVFGLPDPDQIPAIKAQKEFSEAEKKAFDESGSGSKQSASKAAAPVPARRTNNSVTVGSQIAKTGNLAAAALAKPNPATIGKAAASAGSTINFIVQNDEKAYAEYRKMQAKRTRGRVGAR